MQWLNYSARRGGSLQAQGLKGPSSRPKDREQRHFTQRLPGFQTLPYDKSCALLGLDRLELRRLCADLILCYKIIGGLVLLSFDSFFTFVCNSRTQGHSFKLFLPDSRVNCRQLVFAVRVLRIWNSLPEDMVSAAHLSLFVSRLVRVNWNLLLIGKV